MHIFFVRCDTASVRTFSGIFVSQIRYCERPFRMRMCEKNSHLIVDRWPPMWNTMNYNSKISLHYLDSWKSYFSRKDSIIFTALHRLLWIESVSLMYFEDLITRKNQEVKIINFNTHANRSFMAVFIRRYFVWGFTFPIDVMHTYSRWVTSCD